MGVKPLSRWARGPERSTGIDPAKGLARDAQGVSLSLTLTERVCMSRWARGPERSTGIDPAKGLARDAQAAGLATSLAERASSHVVCRGLT